MHFRVLPSMCAVLALVAASFSPALAQRGPAELSFVLSPAASYSDYEGFDLDTGFGVGLAWPLGSSWSLDLRAMHRDGRHSDLDTFQVGARGLFDRQAAWQPFFVAGAHAQRAKVEEQVFCVTTPCPPRTLQYTDYGAFAGGGVDWIFTQRAALRFEGRLAAYDSERSGDIETTLDLTAGIVLRF